MTIFYGKENFIPCNTINNIDIDRQYAVHFSSVKTITPNMHLKKPILISSMELEKIKTY
jgi:hypothetical protein